MATKERLKRLYVCNADIHSQICNHIIALQREYTVSRACNTSDEICELIDGAKEICEAYRIEFSKYHEKVSELIESRLKA